MPVRPKNSAEVRWRIEAQGLLKDSPLCDDSTPIAAHRGRRLDEPTPAGCHRIPPGRESHSPGTTRWQTQALHRRPAHSASAQSQTRRPTPPGEIGHPRHSRYPLRWFRVLVAKKWTFPRTNPLGRPSAAAMNSAECSTITTAKPRELPFSMVSRVFLVVQRNMKMCMATVKALSTRFGNTMAYYVKEQSLMLSVL